MNSYKRIYSLLIEGPDRYWPGWKGAERTARLSSKELEALIKRMKLQAAEKADKPKKTQRTFSF